MQRQFLRALHTSRRLNFSATAKALNAPLASKYADKLKQRAQAQGLTVSELQEKALAEQREQQRQEREARLEKERVKRAELAKTKDASKSVNAPAPALSERHDSSPVRSLSSILNLAKISTATPEQVSALWLAYHAALSDGTGRGYLCASVPIKLYEKMAAAGSKYPTFVIPLARPSSEIVDPATAGEIPYEFFFVEWTFHNVPASLPAPDADPFTAANPPPSTNPQVSAVLFTPLQEYKMRQSFATPYLALTHHTDLVESHGLVLLRGEMTPSSASALGDGQFMLSQADGQRLSLALQKFYLWNADGKAEELLKTFHENPAEFKWEDLLEYDKATVV